MPAILVHNAPSMMRRMGVFMQAAIAERGHQANASHGALFLRVGEADLVREFGVAMEESMDYVRRKLEDFRGSPPSLTLETVGEAPLAADDFKTSNALFKDLCSHAQALGVIGCDAYHKDIFLKALKQAFEKSRMDAQAMAELLPYARLALNAELCKVYAKLDSLRQEAPAKV